MGLGRFGGGVGVSRWLAARGADVLVTDLDSPERLADSVQQLGPQVDAGQVTLRLGAHNVSDFTTCDLVVANPAVPAPWDNRYLRAAAAAGIPVTTEIGLTVERLDRRRVIGVTGSMGKSTTTALIGHILGECGEPVLTGGNLGGSLLKDLDEPASSNAWIVLELSSAMLHWLEGWSPHIAVVTNIADNHKDWHGSFEHYEACKKQILRNQHPGDVAVLGERVAHWPTREGVRRIIVPDSAESARLAIPGRHNQFNAAAALRAVDALCTGIDPVRARTAAETFRGLPHRLQLAGLIEIETGRPPIRCYNDSKSTTPEATLLAIEALGESPGCAEGPGIHLIAGGYDKGADLSPLWRCADRLRGFCTIGATGERLAREAQAAHPRASVHFCGSLDVAVGLCLDRASPGEVILLSPGCASWDQYENYERRGEHFVRLVESRAPRGTVGSARQGGSEA